MHKWGIVHFLLGSSPDIVFSHGSNANWINKILLNRPENSNSNPDDDPSLDNWTPPQLSPNIGDKTGGGGGSRNCRGFKRKPVSTYTFTEENVEEKLKDKLIN